MMTELGNKVTALHLKRAAYLYVRQSTLRQVVEHTESTKRQYALKQRAVQLGWRPEQVTVIDSDLGESGASTVDRDGFQKLVAEVSMGRAGIVLGLEVSRLARNSADWHRLLEICAFNDTLILDEDGIYNPGAFNDRLLLGLKGTMSEAELHVMRMRMIGGVLTKARRGELCPLLPIGFMYDDENKVMLDPDRQVQESIRLVFSLFRRTGSAYALVRHFRDKGLLFPSRPLFGPNRHELIWVPLQRSTIMRVLNNPRYAGAYFFGRTRGRRRQEGGRPISSKPVPKEQWHALIRDAHPGSHGTDALDATLCSLGVFARTPRRGSARHNRRRRLTASELVEIAGVPQCFREVTTVYLETYEIRVSDKYRTLRHKSITLAHFWRFMHEKHRSVKHCSAVLPRHVRDYIPYAIARARAVQRGPDTGEEVRPTAYAWLVELRTFFSDICAWATETDSPFAPFAPRTVPVNRHTLLGHGFEKARARTRARITATVLDLEREMPKIRAFALQRWTAAAAASKIKTSRGYPWSDEVDRFWDWALLELLVQSGLRIEEARELTTLDILKRSLADGRIYYLLHIKPSKYDRARVIPIGDGLGRVLAEIIRHVKRFYNSDSVPVCDHWNLVEKRPRPPAPYLLQGIRHPSTAGIETIRSRIRELSVLAESRRSDGSPLVLLPHDCRRVFASEHLNNNTPVHIIQALLGHASPDTVMIYAKLYPSRLIEEYRKTVRGLYNAHYGDDGLKNPTAEEWAAFSASCNLRDMGTHLCALPTGEHCPRGLICLGCTHAQPKKSAVPIFRRMLASHQRSLNAAHEHNEPAGQIASREMEIVRIKGALQRAEELSDDVAAAIEGVL